MKAKDKEIVYTPCEDQLPLFYYECETCGERAEWVGSDIHGIKHQWKLVMTNEIQNH